MINFKDRRGQRRPPHGKRRRPGPWSASVYAAAALGLVAVAWAGHAFVRTAASGAFVSDRAPPEIVRCVIRPLGIDPLPCASALLIEAETGAVLYEQNADEKRGPASLVKMMLQLIVFEEIAAGNLRLDEPVETSANASTMGGSQVYLKHGEIQTLEAMLDAVIIASANDAAMAVAEHISGTEKAFVALMNEHASTLGCQATRFANVHGLDLRGQNRNVTSARDLGRIARALVRHEKALEISGTWRKPFRGGEFWLNNTNKLLKKFDGLDGLKTGWTPRAGGCFVGTAEREGVRFIVVILKAPPGQGRFNVSGGLLEAAYARQPRWVEVARPGLVVEPVPADTSETAIRASAWGTLRLLLEDGRAGSWRLRPLAQEGVVDRPGWKRAVGYLDYRLDGRTVATLPAHSPRVD